jgi:hypothetical protein
MTFLARFFAGGKTAETVAATVQDSAKATFSLIDNAFYTDQEKAEHKAKAMDIYADLIKTTTQESTGTAAARRWFLMVITSYTLTAATCCIVLTMMGNSAGAAIIKQIISEFWIGEAFASAVSFYYLTHFAKAARGGKNG